MNNIQNNKAEAFNRLISKCWNDVDFKNRLIESPVLTIESFTGKPMNIKKGQKVVVEDQSNTSIVYFNIPAEPNLKELQLSDEQLESISGGDISIGIVALTFVVCAYLFD